MDYKDKYIKYKTKYLELKNTDINNQIGGGKKNIFNKIKIISKFGSGMQGATYLIKLKNKEYILKKQKIKDEQYNDNTMNNQIYREIQFYKWINKLGKNKIFFMNMINYRKIKCNYNIELKNNLVPEYSKDYKYCLELILDKKDYILSNNINLLSDTDLFNGFIQCINILNLMHKSGWIHSDTKTDNIAFNELSSKMEIDIEDYGKITSSYIFSLIDYGSVVYTNFNYDDENFNKIAKVNIDYDLYFLIEYFLLNNYDLYKQINSWQYKKNNMFEIINLIDKEIYEDILSNLESLDYNIDINIIKDKCNIFYRILGWEFLQVLQLKYNDYFYEIINEYYKINAKPKNIINLEMIFEIKKNYLDYTKIFVILQQIKF
jgi:serine/threonine protein kinase